MITMKLGGRPFALAARAHFGNAAAAAPAASAFRNVRRRIGLFLCSAMSNSMGRSCPHPAPPDTHPHSPAPTVRVSSLATGRRVA